MPVAWLRLAIVCTVDDHLVLEVAPAKRRRDAYRTRIGVTEGAAGVDGVTVAGGIPPVVDRLIQQALPSVFFTRIGLVAQLATHRRIQSVR